MIIHTDASCGDSAVGVGYVIRVDGRVYEGSSRFEGSYTTMEAEYLALREAAGAVAGMFNSDQQVFFYTDCSGLVTKMEEPNEADPWIDRREELHVVLAEAGFVPTSWTVQWVPRERNREADALAHAARDR